MPYSNEIWKDIIGFEGFYKVSNHGRILSIKRKIRKWDGERTLKGGILKPSVNLKGYAFVYLYKNGHSQMKTVHRLVADAFIPNPLLLPQINHKDEDKANNHADNLEWCSAAYNITYGNRIRKVSAALGMPIEVYDLNRGIAEKFKNYQEAADSIGVSRATICRHARTGKPTQERYIIKPIK